jgi:dTDP-4-dehydrorhamnose 3,5-epimerase
MLDGIIKTPLKKIELDGGSVFHGMKNKDVGFVDFGEVYFSFVNRNAIKGWKLHKKMTLNLIAPIGEIKFNFIDSRPESTTYNSLLEITLSAKDYYRLTVPPNIWFAFKGIGEGINMLANVADIPHEPNEILRKELNEIKFSDK